MPVFPLVGSTIFLFFDNKLLFSAALSIFIAALSLIEPAGLSPSSFKYNSTGELLILLAFTKGVFPMHSSIDLYNTTFPRYYYTCVCIFNFIR